MPRDALESSLRIGQKLQRHRQNGDMALIFTRPPNRRQVVANVQTSFDEVAADVEIVGADIDPKSQRQIVSQLQYLQGSDRTYDSFG